MNVQLYYTIYLCWILWCCVTFFMNRSPIQYCCSISLLLFLVLLPHELILYDFPVQLAFVLLLFVGIVLAIHQQLRIKQYLLIAMMGYLYTIYFLWRLITPVFNDRTFIAAAVLIGVLILVFLSRDLMVQVTLLINAVCFGQLLYSLICYSYHLQYSMDPLYGFQIVLTILTVLTVRKCWLQGIRRIEQYIQALKIKKRWHV
ncbi:YphA family membrane protein [Gracilibacillus phocaeensis]|uniref:YphA family membrane protein n=1 Tax=Gracilibacillus phocaeensis TaxID=2042304 RepID=UPI003D9C3D56